MNKPTTERFEKFVSPEPTSGCWLWMGTSDARGYGKFGIGCHSLRAHRVAYELYVAPIPKSLHVLHRCDNPSCVNPDHLRLGTQADNNIDAVLHGHHANKRKTHCKRGHVLSGWNVQISRTGKRSCRTCKNMVDRLSYHRRKAVEILDAPEEGSKYGPCTYPDCGCAEARLCMSEGGPNAAAVSLNRPKETAR